MNQTGSTRNGPRPQPPQKPIFNRNSLPEKGLDPARLGLILSPSGFRGVFGSNDEDTGAVLRPGMEWAALALAAAAGEYFTRATPDSGAVLLVGCDARPTGPAIARIMLRLFTGLGIPCRYTGIIAAPEIMAAARTHGSCRGFAYVSASHNPVGHNGLKLGGTDGGVLPGEQARRIIGSIERILASPKELTRACELFTNAEDELLKEIYADSSRTKAMTARLYRDFSKAVLFAGTSELRCDSLLTVSSTLSSSLSTSLSVSLAAEPLGIIGELNGSARGSSIDAEFFSFLGLRSRFFNQHPGEIRHAILPEGEALTPCRDYLTDAWRDDDAFEIGYVPDNDGDRGNIVYIDPSTGCGEIPDAQEVFALSCLAELSFSRIVGGPQLEKQAIVVNGPTSLRIEAIARVFDVPVFRSEVGEANVVGLARRLRSSGYRVRILGEGSNGGTIIHPAAVRDPLNTIGSLTKLLRFRRTPTSPTPAEEWLRLHGRPLTEGERPSLALLLKSLPAYRTTPTGETRALYPVRSSDQTRLKLRYQAEFAARWSSRPAFLAELGIGGYQFVQYRETETYVGPLRENSPSGGGFKVELLDDDGKTIAFLWMRASGTEPVFRVLVDLPGTDLEQEVALLEWHRTILKEADKQL